MATEDIVDLRLPIADLQAGIEVVNFAEQFTPLQASIRAQISFDEALVPLQNRQSKIDNDY